MMQVIHAPWQTNGGETPGITRGTLVRSALAVVILLTLCAWLASTYFGHCARTVWRLLREQRPLSAL
jgi:hypothetical protein